VHLVYCLLQQPEVWTPLAQFGDPKPFGDVVLLLKRAASHFEVTLQRAHLVEPSISAVMQVTLISFFLSLSLLTWF
jgi:hypothetical protein